MARPTLKPDKKKSCYVRVRVTKAERAVVKRRWRASGEKDESTWIRKLILGEADAN